MCRSWESNETIQRLTSQVQELQERMNYSNDSGEFHEVPVNQQGKENVRANPRSTLESSQILCRGIHQFATPSETGEVPVHIGTGALVARKEGIGSTIPMPTFASRRRPSAPLYLWISHRVLWSDSKDSKNRNCNSTNSQIHNHS